MMDWFFSMRYWIVLMVIAAVTAGCAPHDHSLFDRHETMAAYKVDQEADTPDLAEARRYAPVFLINEQQDEFNHVGTPASRTDAQGKEDVYVDSSVATVYYAAQDFTALHGAYRNHIYRIHFERVPYHHLTAGRNGGLIIVLTTNEAGEPVLITTVHTCGCYLAFIPTSILNEAAYPEGWDMQEQEVFGAILPGKLDSPGFSESSNRLQVVIRGGDHRVVDVKWAGDVHAYSLKKADLRPMAALTEIPHGQAVTSFFETAGCRKGYVKNARKWLERVFMSWWSLDLHIGEDKALGPAEETGVIFYTSLKPWARQSSDMWYFARFLGYWGWNL